MYDNAARVALDGAMCDSAVSRLNERINFL